MSSLFCLFSVVVLIRPFLNFEETVAGLPADLSTLTVVSGTSTEDYLHLVLQVVFVPVQ